jgi:8-oxo-dGTP pyrophosphatase MutT (NUDIX family)
MTWEDTAIVNLSAPFESTNYKILEKYYGIIDYKSGFVLLNSSNEVLCVEQSGGNIGFPKGSRDIVDNSAYDTAVRELYEETKISINNIVVMPNIFHFHRKNCNELMLYFVAKLKTDDINVIIDNNEIIDYSWKKMSSIRNIRKKSTPTYRVANVLCHADVV